MEKLDKPKFLPKLVDRLIVLVGFLINVIMFVIPNFNTITVKSIKLSILVVIMSFIVGVLVFGLRYLWEIRKFYEKYEEQFNNYDKLKKNNDVLKEQFAEKQKEIKLLNNQIAEYEFVIANIQKNIECGLCNISEPEKEFLKNLHEIILSDKAFLFNLKGEKYNE